MEQGYWARTISGRFSRRRALQGAASGAVGVGGLLLVGCGSSTNNKGAATGSNSAAVPSASASAAATRAATSAGTTVAATATRAAGSPTPAASGETPRKGGTLSFDTQNRAPDWDVHGQATALVQTYNVAPAYSRLLKFKLGSDLTGQRIPAPDLAASWETPDEKTLIFHIQPNAKFHKLDPVNGRDATADDVVFSFNRQTQLKTNAAYLANIDTMTATDPKTLKITAKKPDPDFLIALAAPWNKIIAKEVVDKFGDLKSAPVIGTGAFIVDSIQPQSVTLKRNPDYFLSGLPYVDGIKYTEIDDRNTALAAFRTGDIHRLETGVTKQELDLLQSQNPKIGVDRWPSVTPYGAMFNSTDGPAADQRVRQAMAKATNRQQIIDTVWFGQADFTPSIVVDATAELPKSEVQQLLAYDPKGAQDLLKAAGVSNWSPTLTVWNNPQSQPGGELIVPMWQQVGVKPNEQLVDNAKSVQIMTTGDGLSIHWGAWPSLPTTTIDLSSRWKTGGSWNGPKLSDQQLDQMIDAQSTEFDANKRKQILLDIQRRILTLLTVQPAARPLTILPRQPQLRNAFWTPYLAYEDVIEMWLAG